MAGATPRQPVAAAQGQFLKEQVADGREPVWLSNQRKLNSIRMHRRLRMICSRHFAKQAVDQVVRLIEKAKRLMAKRTLSGTGRRVRVCR